MLLALGLSFATALAAATEHRDDRNLIPAFARRYRVSCARCHVAAPKLNAVGEAFRLNGYRFPEAQPQPRGEPPIPLGEEPWKDLWPQAVWPGELGASVPLALRIQTDVEVARDSAGGTGVNFRFPNDFYLLGGGSLGEHIGVFLEAEWNRDEGAELVQAKVALQRLIPALGPRLVNLWVGLQNPFLFTFADRQIDLAARQEFLWQGFEPSHFALPGSGGEPAPKSEFRLGLTQPALEVSGLITPRLYYGLGVAQGAGESATDNNHRKDLYFKLRYKSGGLRLDGSYPSGRSVSGAGGQFLDHALILEGFGYLGSEPTASGIESRHRDAGFNARLVRGAVDVGIGFIKGRDDDPWGPGQGALDHSSLFAKGEYAVYPWLITSLKGEQFSLGSPRSLGSAERGRYVQSHLMPGVIALIRQNVRAVAEADLFITYQRPSPLASPTAFWLRLDIAF